jgi:hypothetical protein
MTADNATLESTALRTNPAVFVVQSRLYSPNYQAPGRWVIFNPHGRSAFLAVGGARQDARTGNELFRGMAHQDVIPPIIEILQSASAPDRMAAESAEEYQRLIRAGLLCPADSTATQSFPTYLSRYQRAVYDYPFIDYSDPDWLEKDVARMRQFADLWSPPPLDSDFPGERIPLPPAKPLAQADFSKSTAVTMDALAFILRYAFGTLGTISFKFGDFHHKTSPSGGARHPAEGVIVLRRGLEGIPPGAYHYLPAEHALVESLTLRQLVAAGGAQVELLCRVHVERPMFRYREIRSWRPVLLDVGHITETIRLLAGLWGIPTEQTVPATAADVELKTLADPMITSVIIGDTAAVAAEDGDAPPTDAYDITRGVQTNPLLYLTFDDGHLHANALYPRLTKTRVSLAEFELLSYAIPSSRGDRPTDAASLHTRFPEITSEMLRRLVDKHVLLTESTAAAAYDQTRLWSHYSWYLSLLAHFETRSAARVADDFQSAPQVSTISGVTEAELARSLVSRRTRRSFTDIAISKDDLSQIFQAGTEPRFSSISIFAALHNVTGYPHGTVGSIGGQEFCDSGTRLSREKVREMVIGQYPASAGAITVWLIARVDLSQPAGYEDSIVRLGQLAQRLTLAATARGLGVFSTPAINDDMTFEHLHATMFGPEAVSYVLAMGVS